MAEAQQWGEATRPSRWLALLFPLALLLAAWGTYAAGDYRINRLDLSRFGPCADIPEALARDGYVARHFLPYLGAAVFLDTFAFLALCLAGAVGRPRVVLVVAVGLVWLASAGWHGLSLLVTTTFAR
jgi:hypothetical protein